MCYNKVNVMWMNEEEISKWAFKKCKENDLKKFWSLITDSEWAYYYYIFVKDRPEVLKYIKK